MFEIGIGVLHLCFIFELSLESSLGLSRCVSRFLVAVCPCTRLVLWPCALCRCGLSFLLVSRHVASQSCVIVLVAISDATVRAGANNWRCLRNRAQAGGKVQAWGSTPVASHQSYANMELAKLDVCQFETNVTPLNWQCKSVSHKIDPFKILVQSLLQ